jgi:tetratricopeptide (TPR) repeat protein
MNRKRRLPVSLALLVTFAGFFVGKVLSAAAQDSAGQTNTAAVSGSIAGTVKDPSGAVVAGARVRLLAEADTSRPTGMTAVTDGQGSFTFAAVPPGTYTLEVESTGFPESSRSHVVVASRSRVVADLSLVPPRADNGFNYDDSAQFKPSAVNAAVDPGGYSAAKEVDSYGLMLDYVQSESTRSDHGSRGSQAVNGQAQFQASSPAPPTAAERAAWNESQFLSRGSDLLLHHDLAASIESFQAGVGRFPNSARLATGLGIALSARGEYEKAIASLLRATDLAHSDPRPYLVLAKAYIGSAAPNQQVPERLARLVTLDPKNPLAPYYYALVLAKGSPQARATSDDDAASKQIESLLKSALALDPNFADAHLQLGILYASRSDDPDAIREYQLAARLEPSLAVAHYRLAQTYSRLGDKAAARNELDLYHHLRQQAPAGGAGIPPALH